MITFLALDRIKSLFRYSLGFDHFSCSLSDLITFLVLPWTLFLGISRIRSLFWYSLGYDLFSSTRLDSIIFLALAWILSLFRYSPRFDQFFDINSDSITFPALAWIRLIFFWHSPGFNHFFRYLPRHFSGLPWLGTTSICLWL